MLKKYLTPQKYIAMIFAQANLHVFSHIERLLAKRAHQPIRHPPIFFLGAPRSGSTLAVQVITEALDLGYISNRHCQWYGAPALAERLFRPVANRPQSDYRSNHGTTRGAHAPAECGEWWYRFFRRKPHYVTLDEVDPRSMAALRRSVVALTNAFDGPVLFKNLYTSLRIQAITHYLPESLFIVMHRNEVDNGHSLLEGRHKVFGDYGCWWSMEPPEMERLRVLPVHEQVIEQIRHIHAAIERDLRLGGVQDSRRFDLVYEEFCAAPTKMIDDLQAFLSAHSCKVRKRRLNLPKTFERRDEVRIDPVLYDAMVKYAQSG